MLALSSPSSIAAHFDFCSTTCVVILAFWSPSSAADFAFCFTSCDLVVSRPRVKLVGCKSALNLTVVYSTALSKAGVPVLVLLCVALWFILRDDLF